MVLRRGRAKETLGFPLLLSSPSFSSCGSVIDVKLSPLRLAEAAAVAAVAADQDGLEAVGAQAGEEAGLACHRKTRPRHTDLTRSLRMRPAPSKAGVLASGPDSVQVHSLTKPPGFCAAATESTVMSLGPTPLRGLLTLEDAKDSLTMIMIIEEGDLVKQAAVHTVQLVPVAAATRIAALALEAHPCGEIIQPHSLDLYHEQTFIEFVRRKGDNLL